MGTTSRTLDQDTRGQTDRASRSGARASDRPRARDQVESSREAGGTGDSLANGLGWFSIGLGLAQIAAPRGMARLIGVTDDSRSAAIMRTVGMREIAAGIGILSQPHHRPGWLWGRVAGDIMDLALLGTVLSGNSMQRNRTVVATAAVLGVTALDVLCGQQLEQRSEGNGESSRAEGRRRSKSEVTANLTINRPPEEVYRFWRQLDNLPQFMQHLESVQVLDDRRSHWVARAPAGKRVEWDAVITQDRPNELIGWRSDEDAQVRNEGTVRFRPAPGGRGTEVSVTLRYDPPAGVLGAAISKLFLEEPTKQIPDDLRRFKQVMELGEVMLSDATVRPGPHPAQPDADLEQEVER